MGKRSFVFFFLLLCVSFALCEAAYAAQRMKNFSVTKAVRVWGFDTIEGGKIYRFQVSLRGPAGVGGATVQVTSEKTWLIPEFTINIAPGGRKGYKRIAANPVGITRSVRLRAKLGDQEITKSVIVSPPPPSNVNLEEPADGYETTSLRPQFKWNTYGASSHKLCIRDSALGSSVWCNFNHSPTIERYIVFDQSNTVFTTPTGGSVELYENRVVAESFDGPRVWPGVYGPGDASLNGLQGRELNWRVEVCNRLGCLMSPTRSIRIKTRSARLTSPAHETVVSGTNRTVLFQWEPQAGAQRYFLFIDGAQYTDGVEGTNLAVTFPAQLIGDKEWEIRTTGRDTGMSPSRNRPVDVPDYRRVLRIQ